MLRQRCLAMNLCTAAAESLRDGCHFVLRNVPVVAIENFATNLACFRFQQNAYRFRHVGRMDLLATAFARDRFATNDAGNEVIPFALVNRMIHAINAGRTNCTNRILLAKTETVDELFDRCFVSTVVTGGPSRMPFIKWTIVENPIVHGAARNKNESLHASDSRGLDQLERADDVGLAKGSSRILVASV